jgi:hypothetical protein
VKARSQPFQDGHGHRKSRHNNKQTKQDERNTSQAFTHSQLLIVLQHSTELTLLISQNCLRQVPENTRPTMKSSLAAATTTKISSFSGVAVTMSRRWILQVVVVGFLLSVFSTTTTTNNHNHNPMLMAFVDAIDSINMDLQTLENIDLSALGTQDLDERYGLTWNLTIDEQNNTCQYYLQLNFTTNSQDVPGDEEFTGNCEPDVDTGTAPDGQGWHAPRRRWLQFPKYVYDTTGFDHMSMYWRPCGHAPGGFRKARYDLNFYTVLPQYRAFMVCQEFKNPAVCQYDQPNHIGRGFFSLPRLERDGNFLANMPLRFQPDPTSPEGKSCELNYDCWC